MNETPGEPFDFRKALKAQKRRKLRKEIALGLGAFAIVFAGGMLPALLTTISSLRLYSSKRAPHNSTSADPSGAHASWMEILSGLMA